MDIIRGIGALLAVLAFGVGVVVVLGAALVAVALLVMTARFWVPALLVLLVIGAIIAIICAVATGHECGGG